LLCSAAAVHSHVGTVRYAGADPLWTGIERLPELNAHVARSWPQRCGPLETPLGLWGTLLPLAFCVRRDPYGVVAESHERTMPRLVALTRDLLASGELDRLAGGSMEKAMTCLWDRLEGCAVG
jgi:hypothetical protein